MKTKIYYFISILLGGFILSSCEDFLTEQPESVLTQIDFYTTPTRINQGVIGCYAGLAKIQNDEWMYTELRSDNTCQFELGSSATARIDQTDIASFRISPTFPHLRDYWYLIFQNISNINAVLPSVKDNTYVPIEEQRAQYEGELLFLRGYHYYILTNLFGDMFKVTKVIGPNEAKKIPRSSVPEIYNDIIIPDLKKAALEAPASYSANDKGRATKWAAKGILAKVYMTLGGDENLRLAKKELEDILTASPHYLLTGNNAYADIFNIENEMNPEIILLCAIKVVV